MNSRRLARLVARLAPLAPLAAVVTAGCFATRNDVRLLQADIARLEASVQQAQEAEQAALQRDRLVSARRDSANKEMLAQIAAALATTDDTVRALSNFFSKFRANIMEDIFTLRETDLQMLTMLGVSQRNIQGLQTELQASRDAAAISAPAAGDTAAMSQTPNAAKLFQMGRNLLVTGSASTARTPLQELLTTYPNAPEAPRAQLLIAETFVREKNEAAADSVYQLVVKNYPKSDVAPTALYKRANALAAAGQSNLARMLLTQLMQTYPTADELDRARDLLNSLPRG